MKSLVRNLFVLAVVTLGAATANATALSAARATESKNPGAIKRYLMKASTTIYAGGLVMLDSDGKALPAAAAAGNQGVVGVAVKTVTSGASASAYVEAQEGWFKFAGTSIAQTSVGYLVYAEDDQTVDETRAASEPCAGLLMEVVSSSVGWVWVSPVFTSLNDFGLVSGLNLGTWHNNTDGAWTMTEASEDLIHTFTSNTLTLTSSTGVATYDFGVINPVCDGITVEGAITGANGGTLANSSNNVWVLGENSEDLTVTFAANLATIASTTGATVAITPATAIGGVLSGSGTAEWGSVASGANTACNTTCTAPCLFGFDEGAADAETIVSCSDATADKCLCFGAN